jgi:hypothetical protein
VVSVPGPVVAGSFVLEARATWRLADGTERSGVLTSETVPTLGNIRTGNSVPVWLNLSGDPQPPPPGRYDIILNTLIAALMGPAAAALLLPAMGVVLDHNRLASWGHAVEKILSPSARLVFESNSAQRLMVLNLVNALADG